MESKVKTTVSKDIGMADENSLMAVIRASSPSFRNNHDKIGFAVHAAFIASGFTLIATGRPALSDDALYSASDEVGVDGWNQLVDEYAFVYLSPDKGSKVLVKCVARNGNLLADFLPEGPHESFHLEIDVGEYIGENGGTNFSDQYKNLEKLMKILNSEFFSKLCPRVVDSPTDTSDWGYNMFRPRDDTVAKPRFEGSMVKEIGGPCIDVNTLPPAVLPPCVDYFARYRGREGYKGFLGDKMRMGMCFAPGATDKTGLLGYLGCNPTETTLICSELGDCVKSELQSLSWTSPKK